MKKLSEILSSPSQVSQLCTSKKRLRLSYTEKKGARLPYRDGTHATYNVAETSRTLEDKCAMQLGKNLCTLYTKRTPPQERGRLLTLLPPRLGVKEVSWCNKAHYADGEKTHTLPVVDDGATQYRCNVKEQNIDTMLCYHTVDELNCSGQIQKGDSECCYWGEK